MIATSDVAAVLVTRGNVDMEPIADALPFNVVVYNNEGQVGVHRIDGTFFLDGGTIYAAHPNLSVYGRYAGIEWAAEPVIYVQDDDCVLPPDSIAALLAAYQPGHVACNMPEPFRAHYTDSALVGFGAVFDRDLPAHAFAQFNRALGRGREVPLPFVPGVGEPRSGWLSNVGADFLRCCDVVFTTLTPRILVDVPYENLPHATDPDRMYRQADHVRERAAMLRLARTVRDA